MNKKEKMTYVVGGKYTIIEKIGEGSFGKIFLGENKNTGKQVAVKIERGGIKSILRNEARIYATLKGIRGIPSMRAWGNEGNFNYMVLDLLGNSIEEKLNNCGGKFSLRTVIHIGLQIILNITEIHIRGIIHRDIKPSNFMFGNNGEDDIIYIIDFGLAKAYMDKNQHIERREGMSVIGTPRFISLNVHNGVTPSRRDDLESLGYVFIYLLLGVLPWKEHYCKNEYDNRNKIGEIKKNLDLFKFSKENDIPEEFIIFIEYCRNLKYEETPDYLYLSNLLARII